MRAAVNKFLGLPNQSPRNLYQVVWNDGEEKPILTRQDSLYPLIPSSVSTEQRTWALQHLGSRI
jgi:hypothetical protein